MFEMKKQLPLVSIVVACHNCEDYINQCIDSLTCQTYKNIEILICDDASTDKSYELLKKHAQKDSRIILLKNETCMRAAASRNSCLELCKGEYVAIQDADDFSSKNRIELLLDFLENHPEFDFVSSSAYLFNGINSKDRNIQNIVCKEPKSRHFLWGLPFIHAATMFRTECIQSVSGYRVAKETRRGQDYDMFMRMYAAGYHGANIKEPLYCIRTNPDFYVRRINSSASDEASVRLYGFKLLGLMPIGYLFALKPFVAEMVYRIRNWSAKLRGDK